MPTVRTSDMKLKRLTRLSLLTGASLIMFIIELRFPDILPIPVKLGLANIVTVYAVYRYTAAETTMMLFARIVLGALFSSNLFALIYSFSGAVLCLVGMLLIRKIVPVIFLWLCSIIGAVLHNIGQMAAAVVVTRSLSVLAYLPLLICAGVIAGAFTGICAQLMINRTGKIENSETD